eukprot:gene8086-10954_t
MYKSSKINGSRKNDFRDDLRLAAPSADQSDHECSLPIITRPLQLSPRRYPSKSRADSFPKVNKRSKQLVENNVYRYKIYPGNNGRVILQALRKRPWWYSVSKSDEDSSSFYPAFIWEMYKNSMRYKDNLHYNVVLNHVQSNKWLVSKKGLYFSLKSYCSKNNIDVLKIIPKTFYLVSPGGNIREDDMEEFMNYNQDIDRSNYADSGTKVLIDDEESIQTVFPSVESSSTLSKSSKSKKSKNSKSDFKSSKDLIWIMKPASNTNRGYGITVVQGISGVMEVLTRAHSAPKLQSSKKVNNNCNNNDRPESEPNSLSKVAKRRAYQDGWIVQLYLDRPLLVYGRKFDIRCYVLVTLNRRNNRNNSNENDDQQNILKGYFFREAYVRTSSKKYSLSNIADREAHLTNDAVQKNSKSYGKFEDGNKMDFHELQEAINAEYPNAPKDCVHNSIFPEIKRMSKVSLEAAAEQMKKTSILKSFELFGYDYMVDENLNPVLIEINTNPCLEFVCPLLTNIITDLINNTIKVAIDPLFPPPTVNNRTKACEEAIELINNEEVKFDLFYP